MPRAALRPARPSRVAVACGVAALAVAMLSLAGVVAMHEVELPPLVPAATSVEPPAAASATTRPTTQDAAQREESPPSVESLPAAEARTVNVQVQRAFCMHKPHYLGPLTVAIAGRAVARHEVVNALAIPVDVPAGCTRVDFLADGFEPAKLDLDTVTPKRSPTVVLQPVTKL